MDFAIVGKGRVRRKVRREKQKGEREVPRFWLQ